MPTNLTPIKLSFPEWLRLRREIAKLNQLEVAKAVGVTKQTISSWEKGISKPALNPYQTEQLCLILQITFEELVKGFNGEVEISIN